MAKKAIVLLLVFLWLFFIGQMSGQSALSGDINLIDEGQFAAWVQHMITGKVLYRDFFVQYGPLQIYPLYILSKIFGQSFFILRFYLSVTSIFLGICVAYLLLRRLNVQNFIHIITLVFLTLIPGIHIRHWIGIAALLSLVDAYELQSKKRSLLAGALLLASVIMSTEVGIFSLLLTVFYLLFLASTQKKTKAFRLTALFLVAGIVLSSALFILFALQQGWLSSYVQTSFEIISTLSGINLPNGQGLPIPTGNLASPISSLKILYSKPMLFYLSLLILLVLFSITVIRFFLRKTTFNDHRVFLLICFGILTYASIIGRSGHYFVVVPIVLVCASYYISQVWPLLKSKVATERYLSLFFVFLFLLYGLRHMAIFRFDFLTILQQRESLQASVPRVAPLAISKQQASDILQLQNFMNDHTRGSDSIYVFNNVPALYSLLSRENATRYDLPLLAFSKEKRLETVTSLEKNRPKIIIEDKNAWAVDGVSDRQRQPEVISYILKHYKVMTTLNKHLFIYMRI